LKPYGRVIDRDPIHLAVLIGSTRVGRFGEIVGRWFVRQAELRDDMAVDVIDLIDVDLPVRLSGDGSPALREYLARLQRADAFVIVTPEYNHGYPAGLKQAIDVAHSEWRAKPVAFVSYGGMAGGLRAVEQLRQVFAELHTMSVRDTVSFHNVWPLFDEVTGEPHDSSACNAAATVMLDQLAWWATALRTARRSTRTPIHNREAFRRLYEEAVSNGNLDVIDEVVHPDVVHHTEYAAQGPGAQGLKETAAMLREAFDDFRMTAKDVIADGDKVVARFAVSGVRTGKFDGTPPNGEPFEFEEIMIVRFADGRIAEIWNHSEPLPFG
jgi:NAD(P)H-dependent FMN reductase/predicted ester cyclase